MRSFPEEGRERGKIPRRTGQRNQTITNAFARGIHASKQRKKSSQEGETQRGGERERTPDEK